MNKRIVDRNCMRVWGGLLALMATLAIPTATWAQNAPPLRIGVLTDMNSLFADNSGNGSIVAAQMAVADFGGTVLGRKVEVVFADNQNKPDVGAAITKRWLDNEGVEAIVDVPNSAVALAVQGIARDRKK